MHNILNNTLRIFPVSLGFGERLNMSKGALNNPIEILYLRISIKEKFSILKSVIKHRINEKFIKKYIPNWYWNRPIRWWELLNIKPSKIDLIKYYLHCLWDKI